MTMAIDSNQRPHLGSLAFDHMSYSSSPSFSNPWTTSAPSYSVPGYEHLKATTSRPVTMAMPFTSLPATAATADAPTYAPAAFAQSGLMNSSQGGYEQHYSTAPAPASSYAPSMPAPAAPSSYAPLASYGQTLAQQQQEQAQRRMSPTAHSMPQATAAFNDALDGARGMVAMSQNDITPRNIYGPRGGRSSTDGYGFPPTHSAHSSISSASGYSGYYGSMDSSATDYSSASESLDGLTSRTLPRPNGLVAHNMPPAPQSMMGSFNSKISSSSVKKHKCKVCDKRFTRPSSLQTHMYSHTGEKPFACEVPGCGRNFSVVSNLRRHRKVHKGERGIDEHDHDSPEGSWASASVHEHE